MIIKKAVIPAAGLGTRMLPAAKAVPKELLPILDRPTIQYVVEEAAAGGIDDVLLVTSTAKKGIEDHFRPNSELDQRLNSTGNEALLASINDLIARVKVHITHQPQQRGLGDAVNQARRFVGDEPFACLLGDNVFSGNVAPIRQLIDVAGKLGTAVIGLQEVALEKVNRYGIAGGTRVGDGIIRIEKLVEKPAPHAAPSRLAIAARYVLTPAIFDCLDRTSPGRGGEIQLTDALNLLLSRQTIHGVILSAVRHDIGNPLDWLATNLQFARRDPNIWREIEPLLRRLLE